MKISIIGYYGSNFGDLLMLSALLDYYCIHYDKINIYTYGESSNLQNAFIDHPHLNKIKIFGLSGKIKISYHEFIKTVKGSSYLVWGGGTCFMDQKGTGGLKFMAMARIVKIPVLYLGIGIDSCKKIKTKLIVFFTVFISKRLYFRDEKSLMLANKLSLNLFKGKNKFVPDIANIKNVPSEIVSDKFIVFCCRDLSVYKDLNNDKVNSSLALLAIKICKDLNIHKIVNLVCDVEIDEKQSKKATDIFIENDFEVSTLYGSQVDSSLIVLQNAMFVITSRLHPAVVAQNLRIPYSIYNYSDKNKKFVKEVDEESRLIPRNNIDEHTFNFNKPKKSDLESLKQNIYQVLNNYI